MVRQHPNPVPAVERMRKRLDVMLSDRFSPKQRAHYTTGPAAVFAAKVLARAGFIPSEFDRLGKVGVSLFPHIEQQWIAIHGRPTLIDGRAHRPTKYLNWTRALFDQMRREGIQPTGKDCHGYRRQGGHAVAARRRRRPRDTDGDPG